MRRRVTASVVCLLLLAAPGAIATPEALDQDGKPMADELRLSMQAFEAGRYAEAEQRFRTLSHMGSAIGETMLGILYARGLGVERDSASAAAFYFRAANRGYPPAQLALAHALKEGLGTARDPAEAYFWSLLARQGDRSIASEAERLGATLERELSRDAEADAAEASRRWRPANAIGN